MRSSITFAATVLSIASLSHGLDPESVSIGDRNQWCTSQRQQCPLLCLQYSDQDANTVANDCDPELLTFSCVCAGGQQPNASEFSLTLPYFICTETNNQCVTACGQDSTCATSCRTDHPCGASDPKKYNATSTASASSTATQTGGSANPSDYGNLGDGSSSSQNQPGAKGNSASTNAIMIGRDYGLGVVVAGLFAGFAILL